MKKPPITKSNIWGSIQEIPFNPQKFFQEFNFSPRSLTQGIGEIRQTTENNKEAVVLYRYIHPGKREISDQQIWLYQEGLRVNNIDSANFSGLIYRFPFLLGGLDAITKLFYRSSIFQKRIILAAALTEASVDSAQRLLPKDRNSVVLLCRSAYLVIRAILKIVVGSLLLLFPNFFRKNVA